MLMSRPGRSTTVKTLRLPSQMLHVRASWDGSSFEDSEPDACTSLDEGAVWRRIFFPQALRVKIASKVACFIGSCMACAL